MATGLGENKRDTRIPGFCRQASLISFWDSPASLGDSAADGKTQPGVAEGEERESSCRGGCCLFACLKFCYLLCSS